MSAYLWIKFICGALMDKRRRASTWRHPIWCARFYWQHARKFAAYRALDDVLPLPLRMKLWEWRVREESR
jgi:hypothetical protein